MKKIFLDTNFIIDLLVRDSEFSIPAKKVLEKGAIKNYKFYVCFLSVANFAYISRKGGYQKLKENIELICDLFEIIPNDRDNLIQAWSYNPKDYEDALQYTAAISNKCECIITRNEKDFQFSEIPVLSPADFLKTV